MTYFHQLSWLLTGTKQEKRYSELTRDAQYTNLCGSALKVMFPAYVIRIDCDLEL